MKYVLKWILSGMKCYSQLSGGLGSAGLVAGLSDLEALSQHKPFWDSFLWDKSGCNFFFLIFFMFLAAQLAPPLRWDCTLKGDLAAPDFPWQGRGCHRLLGKHNVLLQAPSTGLSWRWSGTCEPTARTVLVGKKGRWILFCNSSPFQHMERRTRQNPKRGSPGLSSALPCVIFNFLKKLELDRA